MRLHIVLESFPNTEARLSAYLDAMVCACHLTTVVIVG